MRIHPIDGQFLIKKYGSARRPEAEPGFAMQGADGVDLSDEAVTYANAVKDIRASLEETASEDALRIRNLAKQIQSGTYHVDTKAIVDKMMNGL